VTQLGSDCKERSEEAPACCTPFNVAPKAPEPPKE
jgi:hypothetical protein